MILLHYLHVLLLASFVMDSEIMEVKPEAREEYEQICRNVTRKPFFANSMVAGKTWRTYYAWNIKLDDECADVTYKYANDLSVLLSIKELLEANKEAVTREKVTLSKFFSRKRGADLGWRWQGQSPTCIGVAVQLGHQIINRIWKDMYGYMKTQPRWSEAVLLMTIGRSREMLLFEHKSGVAGEFIGVPNIQSSEIFATYRGKNEVPLYKIVMKLLHKGRYLLSSDCSVGVTTLSVRRDNRPKRVNIDRVAATIRLGDGYPACINEPDPE